MKLKKIEVLPLGINLSLIYLVIGLVMGILNAIMTKIPSLAENMSEQTVNMGFLLILIFPVVYLIVGFLSGIIIAFLYNLIAKYTGGISFELSEGKKKK